MLNYFKINNDFYYITQRRPAAARTIYIYDVIVFPVLSHASPNQDGEFTNRSDTAPSFIHLFLRQVRFLIRFTFRSNISPYTTKHHSVFP